MHLLAVAATVLMTLAVSRTAQTPMPGVEVQAWTDTQRYPVGSWIDLHIRLTGPPAVEVVGPAVLPRHGPFDVLRLHESERAVASGVAVYTWVVRLTTFEFGTVTVPPLPLDVTIDDVRHTVHSPGVDLVITKPGVNPAGGLRPARPPPQLPPGQGRWILRAAGLMAALSLLALSYLGFKLRIWTLIARVRDGTAPDLNSRLMALERRLPVPVHEIEDFYTEISHVVRNCVEIALDVPAANLSTSELIQALTPQSEDTLPVADLERLLRMTDRVKFAAWRPDDPVGHAAALERARHVVHSMRL